MHAAKRKRLAISQSRSMIGKVAVMGLLEWHRKDEDAAQVRTQVIANRKKHQLETIVAERVEGGASLYANALRSYDRMGQRGYVHKVIDHESYVDGAVHTNGLENVWLLLKRAQGDLRERRTPPPVPLLGRTGVPLQQSQDD